MSEVTWRIRFWRPAVPDRSRDNCTRVTQLPTVLGSAPRSRATWAISSPVSQTMQTAPPGARDQTPVASLAWLVLIVHASSTESNPLIGSCVGGAQLLAGPAQLPGRTAQDFANLAHPAFADRRIGPPRHQMPQKTPAAAETQNPRANCWSLACISWLSTWLIAWFGLRSLGRPETLLNWIGQLEPKPARMAVASS